MYMGLDHRKLLSSKINVILYDHYFAQRGEFHTPILLTRFSSTSKLLVQIFKLRIKYISVNYNHSFVNEHKLILRCEHIVGGVL